ncbi:MAG TPA: deoxyribonuclease V [Rudaea sp.]|jgi:deoxyribonuclease V|nr:deoxyribonuclease V [Rudaea sp.]
MTLDPFPGWDRTIAGARKLQTELAHHVRLVDDFPPLSVIAGVDVGFEENGTITRAAAVLVDAKTLALVADVVVRLPTSMPYVPGLLSFRELPAVFAALEQLPRTPDLVMVDGQGIAHPRGLGIAAHLGVASGLPTIGVAKSILVGRHADVGARRGDRAELIHNEAVIGYALRSKDNVRPLIVSPGNRVSLQTACDLVLASTTRYRLPEPTRFADHIASRRDIKKR